MEKQEHYQRLVDAVEYIITDKALEVVITPETYKQLEWILKFAQVEEAKLIKAAKTATA